MHIYIRIIVIIILAAFIQACSNDKPKPKIEDNPNSNQEKEAQVHTDLLKAGLKGEVQYLEEIMYSKAIDVLKEEPDNVTLSAYTTEGRLDSSVTKASYGEEKNEVSFNYQYQGNEVVVIQKLNNKVSNFEIKQTLDEKGRVIKIAQHYGGKAAFTEVYKNNLAGQWLEKTYETPANYPRPADMPCKETRTYDDKGRLAQESIYLNGEGGCAPNKRIDYKNNNQGDPTQLIFLDVSGDTLEVRNWSYKYDEYGNWVERTAYDEMKKPLNRTARTIKYYTND